MGAYSGLEAMPALLPSSRGGSQLPKDENNGKHGNNGRDGKRRLRVRRVRFAEVFMGSFSYCFHILNILQEEKGFFVFCGVFLGFAKKLDRWLRE